MTAALQQQWFGTDLGYTSSGLPAFNVHTLDASNDSLEWIFQAQEAITISRIGFHLGTITGTTPTYRGSLCGVDVSTSSAFVDATIKGATNNALVDFSPSGLGWSAGTWHWLNLGETYACARGELLGIRLIYQSGTVDASNFATFSYNVNGATTHAFPRAITNTAGTRSHKTESLPIYGYGSAGTAYGRPLQTLSSINITNASSPREVGMKFTVPAGWGNTYKIGGAVVHSSPPAVATNLVQKLYSGGGAADVTVLQDWTLAAGVISIGGLRRFSRMLFDEASLTTLNYGDTYRFALENSGSATNWQVFYAEVADAADWDAFPGAQNITWTSRNSGGNWTDLATRRMSDWSLLIDDITEPTAGGLLTPAGMSGGIHG